MTTVIKGPSGSATFEVAGKSIAIADYGAATPPVPSGGFVGIAGRNAVMSPDPVPTTIEVVTQPTGFRLIARSDGRLTAELQDMLTPGTYPFQYRADGGAVVDQDITITANVEYEGGWTKGKFYLPKVDPVTDAVVVEPSETTKFIYVSNNVSTYDAAAIVANEPSLSSTSEVTGTWLTNNNVDGEAFGYGATEAYAVGQEVAEELLRIYRNKEFETYHMLFNRGDTFIDGPGFGALVGGIGESPLHPNYVGAYGTGALPVFSYNASQNGDLAAYSNNIIVQDVVYDGLEGGVAEGTNLAFDNIKIEGKKFAMAGAAQFVSRGITLRRLHSTDATLLDPESFKNAQYTEIGTNKVKPFDASGNIISDATGWTYAGVGSGVKTYGTFVINADGSWNYTLDAAAVEALAAEAEDEDTYAITITRDSDSYVNNQTLKVQVLNHPTKGVILARIDGQKPAGDDRVKDVARWSTFGDRYEAIFANNNYYMLVDKFFMSGAAWGRATGYRPDRSPLAGKPPENSSHAIYTDSNLSNAQFSNAIIANCGHSALQLRCGGIVQNILTFGCNTGLAPLGEGPSDYASFGGRGTDGCVWSWVHRWVQTSAGQKDYDGYTSTNRGGINPSVSELTITSSIVINDEVGDIPAWSDPTAVSYGTPDPDRTANGGSVHFPYNLGNSNGITGTPATEARFEVAWSNWARGIVTGDGEDYNDNANDMTFALSQSARDNLTLGNFDESLGTAAGTGSRDTFDTRLRAMDAPWSMIDQTNDYFLQAVGKAKSTRSVAQEVSFLPDPIGETPAQIATCELDWDTGDLPGHVAGDSINLADHRLFWCMTPENSIDDFSFGGPDGELQMWGGKLAPQGTVTVDASGNNLEIWQGAEFHLAQTPSGGVLNVKSNEARFVCDGTITDNIDVTGYGKGEIIFNEGSATTFASGRTLEVSGNTKAAFDGVGGGSASLTLATGSTLAFKRGTVLHIDGMTVYDALATKGNMRRCAGRPEVGDIIEGETSGATAVVSGVYLDFVSSAYLVLDDVTGQFIDNENLLGPTWAGSYYIGDSRDGLGVAGGDTDLAVMGQVDGAPAYEISGIREARSGMNGTTAPNLTSNVTLGSGAAVTVDITGLAAGIYDLIDVDSLTDGGATLPPGVAVSGNKLVLTI